MTIPEAARLTQIQVNALCSTAQLILQGFVVPTNRVDQWTSQSKEVQRVLKGLKRTRWVGHAPPPRNEACQPTRATTQTVRRRSRDRPQFKRRLRRLARLFREQAMTHPPRPFQDRAHRSDSDSDSDSDSVSVSVSVSDSDSVSDSVSESESESAAPLGLPSGATPSSSLLTRRSRSRCPCADRGVDSGFPRSRE